MNVHENENENAGRLKKRMGVFYTSPLVARKLVGLTFDPFFAPMWQDLSDAVKSITELLLAPSPELSLSKRTSLYQLLIQCLKPIFTLRVCDPAMGNGIFLAEALRYMLLLHGRLINILQFIPQPPPQIPPQISASSEQELFPWALFRGFWDERVAEDRKPWATYVLTHMLYGVDIRAESRDITIHTLLRAYHGWIENGSTELDNLTVELSSLSPEDRLLATKLHLHLIVANSLVCSIPDSHPLPNLWRKSEIFPQFYDETLSVINLRSELLLCTSLDEFERVESQYTTVLRSLEEIISKFPTTSSVLLPKGVIPMDWSLEFPEIFLTPDSDGFSLLLCNPPWKPHQLNEPDFFSKFDSLYPNLSPTSRKLRRATLLEDPEIQKAYDDMRAHFALLNTAFGQWFPLQQEKKFNLFKLFLERAFSLLQSGGRARAGWIVPLGLFGEARATLLRTALFQHNAVSDIYHLFSGNELFPNITDGLPFALFTYTADKPTHELIYYPNLHMLASLSQPSVQIPLRMNQLRAISPRLIVAGQDIPMLALPLVGSLAQFLLLEQINQFPKLRIGWGLQAKRELNRTDDVRNGVMTKSPSAIPVLEGKHLVHYGFSVASPRFFIDSTVDYASYRPIVSRTRIVWRNVSNIRLRRRMFCAVIPPGIATVNSLNYICECESKDSVHLEGDGLWYLFGLLGSLVAEFQLRIFSTNNNLNQYLIENLALPLYNPSDPLHQHLVALVKDFQPTSSQWADQMVTLGHQSEAKAALTQKYWHHLAEIDAVCLKIYGLDSDQFEILQGKFPKLEPAYFSMISTYFIETIFSD